jgi:hypothetical protein
MSSPFIKASKETLLRQCAEEIGEREGEFLAELHMDFHVTLALISMVQLALRHPGVKGVATAQLARDVVNGLIGRMKDAGYVANAELACLGFDPDYDDEREAKPQPALLEMPQPTGNGLKSERDRIAASECVRLMQLIGVYGEELPHAGQVTAIVGARLVEIADNGAGDSIDQQVIAKAVDVGRKLKAYIQTFAGCPCDGPHCSKCGCCAHKACEGGCFWITPTLCSACVEAS